MMKRISTGLIVGIVVATFWFLQGWPMRIAVWCLTIVAAFEMVNTQAAGGMKPVKAVPILYAVLSMPAYVLFGSGSILPLFMLFALIAMTAVILRGEPDFDAMAQTLFPMIYPVLLLSSAYPLQDLKEPVLAVLATGLSFSTAFLTDILAWFTGRLCGKRKLIPAISPKKTVEGALGGLLGGPLAVLATLPLARGIVYVKVSAEAAGAAIPSIWLLMLVGLIAGVFSQVGDLAASTVKRRCGLKDYGTILPGHGGIMDRIDSMLFNCVIWHIFFMMFIGG